MDVFCDSSRERLAGSMQAGSVHACVCVYMCTHMHVCMLKVGRGEVPRTGFFGWDCVSVTLKSEGALGVPVNSVDIKRSTCSVNFDDIFSLFLLETLHATLGNRVSSYAAPVGTGSPPACFLGFPLTLFL